MASLVVNRGLLRIGQQAFQSTNYSATRNIQVMAVDDATGAFLAANTKLNDGTGYTQEFDQVFTATPTESGQTIICSTIIPTGSGNFTIRRISTHDNAAGSVDGTTTTLVSGVDGQALTKTSDFTMTPTLNHLFTSV